MLDKLNSYCIRWSGIGTLIGLLGGAMTLIPIKYFEFARNPYFYFTALSIMTLFGVSWMYHGVAQWWQKRLYFTNKSIDMLGRHMKLDANMQKRAKGEIQILIIDDREAMVIRKAIKELDYNNICAKQQLPKDNIVGNYPIIIVDVNGVGSKRDSNGMEFAINYKKTHPLTQIVLISAFFNEAGPEKMEEAEACLDGIFKKGASYDKDMRAILDKCVDQVTDPVYIWRTTRDVMLSNGTPIGKVAYFENQFVSVVEGLYLKNGKRLPHNWIDAVVLKIDQEAADNLRTLGAVCFSDKPSI